MSTIVGNFICINDDCELIFKNQPVEVDKGDTDNIGCEVCGKPMKMIGRLDGVSLGKFRMKSRQERIASLKKRSHNDNQKDKDTYHQKNHPNYMP